MSVAKKQLVTRPFPAVRIVAEWALVAAFALVASLAVDYALAYFHVPCSPSSVFLRCVRLTRAEAAEGIALRTWMLWCTGAQVAAAALALLLPCRHRGARRDLAYVALAAAIASHCMYASAVNVVLIADPGYLLFRICGRSSCHLHPRGGRPPRLAGALFLEGGELKTEEQIKQDGTGSRSITTYSWISSSGTEISIGVWITGSAH
ncbi:hypothetical protein BAE44_0026263 [Dichanthelium oligosanthes]|uniref:Uncharacterized protein n=1 Tax=Dichanthelium oligosanthes TaxID=888268 RepID=A0A1E5UIL6_9POAL|nr:hypothetical protein BAE44_0026263 [Dichanthelium oligosanthes]